MGQRKYLIFFIIIFHHSISLPSPWIPTSGSYKYNLTTISTNSSTKNLDKQKIALAKKIDDEITRLYLKHLYYDTNNSIFDRKCGTKTSARVHMIWT